jgi:hypothetical protein
MQFQPGQSGNPAGRPRGARNKRTILLENLMDGEAEAIARKAFELAKNGEMAAIRLGMDRLMPRSKGEHVTCELPAILKPADSVVAISAILAATANGELTPAEAANLCKIIDVYLRTLEATVVDERLTELEKQCEADEAKRQWQQNWAPATPFISQESGRSEPAELP